MIELDIQIDTREVEKFIQQDLKSQIPFALSRTLNDLAFHAAKKILPPEADTTFEGGATRYTKTGFSFEKSTKQNLVAKVFVDRDTHEYLITQIKGGTRLPRNRYVLIAQADARKNRFGNMTKGYRDRLFTDEKRFFDGIPKGMAGENHRGVWERYGRGGRKLRMIARYSRSAKYEKKLDMPKIIEEFVGSGAGFRTFFPKNFAFAVKTAR